MSQNIVNLLGAGSGLDTQALVLRHRRVLIISVNSPKPAFLITA